MADSPRTIRLKNVEMRLNDDGSIDEIVCYAKGKCVFHLEQMSGNHFWAAAYEGRKSLHMQFTSKSTVTAWADGEKAE